MKISTTHWLPTLYPVMWKALDINISFSNLLYNFQKDILKEKCVFRMRHKTLGYLTLFSLYPKAKHPQWFLNITCENVRNKEKKISFTFGSKGPYFICIYYLVYEFFKITYRKRKKYNLPSIFKLNNIKTHFKNIFLRHVTIMLYLPGVFLYFPNTYFFIWSTLKSINTAKYWCWT